MWNVLGMRKIFKGSYVFKRAIVCCNGRSRQFSYPKWTIITIRYSSAKLKSFDLFTNCNDYVAGAKYIFAVEPNHSLHCSLCEHKTTAILYGKPQLARDYVAKTPFKYICVSCTSYLCNVSIYIHIYLYIIRVCLQCVLSVWFYTKSMGLITKPKCIWEWHNGEFEEK